MENDLGSSQSHIHCKHKNTRMWEPHLAGARKCLDCEMVYNPNTNPQWQFEEPSLEEVADALADTVESYIWHDKEARALEITQTARELDQAFQLLKDTLVLYRCHRDKK